MPMNALIIPNSITEILRILERSGHRAFLVGGCVRDGLMGIQPHDWDICTDAAPEQTQALFPDTLDYGMRHGTVTVRWKGAEAEITTFRAESTYTDHRRPDHVTFISDLRADLARRDFTVNAIAMDADGRLQDPFHGAADLRDGVLRAVGAPEARFQEDALRMLRAIRFSAQLGFTIEQNTLQAICACAPLASSLAAERVCAELEKTLLTNHPEKAADFCKAGLLLPWGIERLTEDSAALGSIPAQRDLRWMGFALCLEDTAPLKQLRLDKKTAAACEAVRALRNDAPRGTRYWKQAISQYGHALAGSCAEVLSCIETSEDHAVVEHIQSSGDCCRLGELAVGGADALAIGLKGRQIRTALDAALHHIWDCPEDNTREILLDYLRKEAEQHG